LILFDSILITVTSLSVFFDLRMRRIPNWLILFGLSAGLILNFYSGANQFSYSLIGFVAGIGIFIVPFSLGCIGAGDVKYFGVIGALLGVRWLPRVLFYSSIAAGVMAIGAVLVGHCRLGSRNTIWTEWKIAALSFGRVLPESVNTRVAKGAYSVPWGVALSVGTILSYFMDPLGHWAGF
jgi:Flp pilus assembly protein protease CpaA